MSKTPEENGQAAIGKFFLRIGQVKASQPWRDEWTDYLFPLHLLMDAEGMLPEDVRKKLLDGESKT